MKSHLSRAFRDDFAKLPGRYQRMARSAYRLFESNPYHSSLKFKKLELHDDIWSVRVAGSYRAVGVRRGDAILWIFIGSHADYDKLLEPL